MPKLVAMGDSIMWGQGNTDDNKFVTLVSAWLDGRGKTRDLELIAHSGAIAAPTPRDAGEPQWEEVPEVAPSVHAQSASVDPEDVDIVLVCAGINDVSAFHIVVANPFDPEGVAKIEQATQAAFDGPVRQLLTGTLTRFPNANVVALGYYPIISRSSGARALLDLMKHLGTPLGLPKTLDAVAEHVTDDVLELAIAAEKSRMVDQCAAFDRVSRQMLTDLVADLSAQFGKRMACALPTFGEDNAFAAPTTWLWSGTNDPVYPARFKRFTEQLAIDPFAWPLYTPFASICHPNELGSVAYANAITGALETLGY